MCDKCKAARDLLVSRKEMGLLRNFNAAVGLHGFTDRFTWYVLDARGRPYELCICGAYPFPHHADGGKCRCDYTCAHGFSTFPPAHPLYNPMERCPDCDDEEVIDHAIDWARDSRFERRHP